MAKKTTLSFFLDPTKKGNENYRYQRIGEFLFVTNGHFLLRLKADEVPDCFVGYFPDHDEASATRIDYGKHAGKVDHLNLAEFLEREASREHVDVQLTSFYWKDPMNPWLIRLLVGPKGRKVSAINNEYLEKLRNMLDGEIRLEATETYRDAMLIRTKGGELHGVVMPVMVPNHVLEEFNPAFNPDVLMYVLDAQKLMDENDTVEANNHLRKAINILQGKEDDNDRADKS